MSMLSRFCVVVGLGCLMQAQAALIPPLEVGSQPDWVPGVDRAIFTGPLEPLLLADIMASHPASSVHLNLDVIPEEVPPTPLLEPTTFVMAGFGLILGGGVMIVGVRSPGGRRRVQRWKTAVNEWLDAA